MKKAVLPLLLFALVLTLGLSQSCSDDDTKTPTEPEAVTPAPTPTPGPTPVIAPTCSIAASQIVRYGEPNKFTVTITGGPANGSFSPASGACSSFTGSSGLECLTANLTTPGITTYTLTVTNSGGSSTCTASVDVGCQTYRVWNNIAVARGFVIQRLSFADFCNPNVASGAEITESVNERLLFLGKTMKQYAGGTCGGALLGSLTYDQALLWDAKTNGGNGNCRVNFVFPDR